MKTLLLLSFTLLCPMLQAHEDHVDGVVEPAQTEVTHAMQGVTTAALAGASSMAAAAKAAPKIDWLALIHESMNSHRHNKIVHFPIALGLVGAFFLMLSGKFPSLKSGARWMLFIAAVTAIFAIVTGHAQADDIEGDAMREVLKVHAGLGLAICIGLWLSWLLSFVESAKSWLPVPLFLLLVAIVLEGTLGGALAHMQF
jgi:uncharacterized membrane protein